MKSLIALAAVIGLTLGGLLAYDQGFFNQFLGPSLEDRVSELESQNKQLAQALRQLSGNLNKLYNSADAAFRNARQIDMMIAAGMITGDCNNLKVVCELRKETRKCSSGKCTFAAVVIDCDKEYKQCMKQLESISGKANQ